jgi:hypothetical protein
MPNQAQHTAESKPRKKKGAASSDVAPEVAKSPRATEPKAAPKPRAAAPKAPRKRSVKQQDAPAGALAPQDEAQIFSEVTFEMIAVRAYFLAENRKAFGMQGDASSDWYEAEKQLNAESAAIAAALNHN